MFETAGRRRSRPPGAASAGSARRASSAASPVCTPRALTTPTGLPRPAPLRPISAAAPAGSPSSTPGRPTPGWRWSLRAWTGSPTRIDGPTLTGGQRSRGARRSRPDPMWPSGRAVSPTTPRRRAPWSRCGPARAAMPPTSTAGWLPRLRLRLGGRPAACPVGAPPPAGTRRWTCRRGIGQSRCARAGWSPAIWRPTQLGVSPAASLPPRSATAARSAASSTRRWPRPPTAWPRATAGRSGCCGPAPTRSSWAPSGRRSPRGRRRVRHRQAPLAGGRGRLGRLAARHGHRRG